MTVRDLIEEIEEVDDLDVVIIKRNELCSMYEEEDIEFIDDETLDLFVKHHNLYSETVMNTNIVHLYIECY